MIFIFCRVLNPYSKILHVRSAETNALCGAKVTTKDYGRTNESICKRCKRKSEIMEARHSEEFNFHKLKFPARELIGKKVLPATNVAAGRRN